MPTDWPTRWSATHDSPTSRSTRPRGPVSSSHGWRATSTPWSDMQRPHDRSVHDSGCQASRQWGTTSPGRVRTNRTASSMPSVIWRSCSTCDITAEAVLVVEAGAALACTELALGRRDDADATTEALSEVRRSTPTASSCNRSRTHSAPNSTSDEAERRSGLRWARSTDLATDQHRFLWYDTGPAQIEVLLASEPDAARGRATPRPSTRIRATPPPPATHHPPPRHPRPGPRRPRQRTRRPRHTPNRRPHGTPRRHRPSTRRPRPPTRTTAPPPRRHRRPSHPRRRHPHRHRTPRPRTVRHHQRAGPTAVPGEPTLTAREADVLRLLADRYSNKEIARELLIAPATVKKHTVTLYDKLNVHGRREAVAKAHTLGVINS